MSFLADCVGAIARGDTTPELARDTADMLSQRRILPTESALLRARAIDLEDPDNPAALERVDPDIAAAIRRIRGVTDPDELFRRGTGPQRARKARR
jgi:hypothetical protein